jgi:arginase
MELITVPYHLDERLTGWRPPAEPYQTVEASLPPGGDGWRRMAALYEPVADRVRQARHPVVASGDCTASLGVLAGLQRAGHDPGVVWFDGHGDFNTAETTPSGYLGGMPLALAVGRGKAAVVDRLGLRPVPEERVVLVGARDLDPAERRSLESSKVTRVEVADLTDAVLPDGPLYLHLDLDVIDPAELPGLLFPAPDGPALSAVRSALDRVVATGRVAAVGLACTWHHPAEDPARTDAVVREVLAAVTAGA